MDTVEEYRTLRAEMLHRFQKIHDIYKFGSTALFALLAFIVATPIPGSNSSMFSLSAHHSFLLLEAFIVVIGIAAISEFRIIYRIGTYIALFCEDGIETRWMRMVRKYPNYLEETGDVSAKFPLPGHGWGEDSAVFAFVLILLNGVSLIALGMKVSVLDIFSILTVILFVLNICVVCYLLFGMKGYREYTESKWMQYGKAWGSSFTDPYNEDTKSTS